MTCADGVYVIKTASGHVSKVPESLHQPHGVTVTPDGKHAWVTDSERDQVVVLATSGLRTVGRINVGKTPWNTAFKSDGSSAYVTNSNDNTVSVINTATQRVTKAITLGSFTYTDTVTTFTQPNQIPTAIGLAPDNRYMWVACNVSGSLAVIDTTTQRRRSTRPRPASAPSRPPSPSPEPERPLDENSTAGRIRACAAGRGPPVARSGTA